MFTNTFFTFGSLVNTRFLNIVDNLSAGATGLFINNFSNTTTSVAAINLKNQASDNSYIELTNSGYTATGPYLPSQFVLSNTGNGGIVIALANTTGNIDIASNSNTLPVVYNRFFNNGHAGFNKLVDSGAYVNIGKNTASVASLYIDSSSVDVSSPKGYQIWNNAGYLKFNNLNLSPATTVNNDLGAASLAWRDIYFSHTVGESAIGATGSLGTNVSTMTAAGNDEDFQLTITVSAGGASGTVGDVTFGRTWGATPKCVISPSNTAAETMVTGGVIGINGISTTQAQVTGTLAAGTSGIFTCHCGQ